MFIGYTSTIFDGVWLTLQLSLYSMFLASILGFINFFFSLSRLFWLTWVSRFYSNVIRGIPDLVLIYLIFYGGQDLLNRCAPLLGYYEYIDLNPLIAGVGTLGFIFGAYISETFRGAFIAIPPGQAEAGLAYGMKDYQILLRILFPQMIRLALPGLTNNWLVLIKATALVSIIGLQDMMFKAKQAADSTRHSFTFFLVVSIFYLILTSLSLLILRRIEKRYFINATKVSSL